MFWNNIFKRKLSSIYIYICNVTIKHTVIILILSSKNIKKHEHHKQKNWSCKSWIIACIKIFHATTVLPNVNPLRLHRTSRANITCTKKKCTSLIFLVKTKNKIQRANSIAKISKNQCLRTVPAFPKWCSLAWVKKI